MKQHNINTLKATIAELRADFSAGFNKQAVIQELQRIIDARHSELDLNGIQERNALTSYNDANELYVSPEFLEMERSFNSQINNTPAPDTIKAIPDYSAKLAQHYRHRVLTQAKQELESLAQMLQAQHDAIKEQPIPTTGDPRGIAPLIVEFTPEQLARRAQLKSRIGHIQEQGRFIDTALKRSENQAPQVDYQHQSYFNEFAGQLNLGSATQTAADALVHDCLLRDPAYSASLKAQAAANTALGKLPKTDTTNFEKNAATVLEHLEKIEKTLPHENKHYATRQTVYNNLANGVPRFDRHVNTHFATQGRPISKGFSDVYDELEGLLYGKNEGINSLINKIEKLSNTLNSTTLSKNAAETKAKELEDAITKLKGKAQEFNEFLLRYSVRDGRGLSMLSSIDQQTLDDMAHFAETLLKETNTKAKRIKEFQLTLADVVEGFIPTRLIEKLWDASHKAADNTDSQTLIGAMGSSRHNTLVSDPAILKEYGQKCKVVIHHGTGFTGLNHRTEETDYELPIHGDDRHGDKFSIIRLVEQTFPDNPQRHMRWSNDGKTLHVTWRDEKERDKWLGALKKLHEEYTKAEQKADELEAKLKVPQPLQASLPVKRPSFTDSARGPEPAVAPEQQPPAVTVKAG